MEGGLEALSSGGLCFSSHPMAVPSYATDLVVCVALGCDMFDCVYPTRTAVSPRQGAGRARSLYPS